MFPAWCYVDRLEHLGRISGSEAECCKNGIFGLMVLWGLEASDLIAPRLGVCCSKCRYRLGFVGVDFEQIRELRKLKRAEY